jgi:hypothetical protein
MRIISLFLVVARTALGLVGCVMVLSGLAGLVRVFIDAPWWIVVSAIVDGLLGCLLAYGAFHHFPRERDPRFNEPAA